MGGTGDLMRSKLLPAIYHLTARGLLHERSLVLGVARAADLDDASYRVWGRQALADAGLNGAHAAAWCEVCLYYQSIGPEPDDYRVLASRLAALEREHDLPGNRVFDLALPPQVVARATAGLGRAGLHRSGGWTRLVVEKPFGRDLVSAQALNRLLQEHFDESQLYRIDHYLGKETVQNLLVFRFANPVFETLWNRDRVEHVQITVAEQVGVEGRAGYYEQTGALRDIVQNHLTQLLTLVAMEVPVAFEANAIRNEKVKVLRAVAPVTAGDVVLGQYARGSIDGRDVPAYREEHGVAAQSNTETFASLRLTVSNWRWHGVPFYLRAGKRLPRRSTQIVVTFRRPPVSLFPALHSSAEIQPNVLVITIQPDEGFELGFEVKAPGQAISLNTQRLRFKYADAFSPLPDAYETLLLDVLTGDQTLFVRADEVEEAWRLYTPVLERPPQVHLYPAGTWGPASAAQLLATTGAQWIPS
jgi:glucose-6-phosphate 1-dehydrogenase